MPVRRGPPPLSIMYENRCCWRSSLNSEPYTLTSSDWGSPAEKQMWTMPKMKARVPKAMVNQILELWMTLGRRSGLRLQSDSVLESATAE